MTTPRRPRTGFAVIYQWRLKAGLERQFLEAWTQLTEMQKRRGARGSRLHTSDYGSWLAYAQWPDRATWESSCTLHEQDAELSRRMLDAVEETWAPIFLTVTADHLLAESEDVTAHVTH